MTFSEKISALRKQKGWSQEELAEKLMVTRQAVSKWESAQSMPDLDKLVQLSEALGVSTDYLLKDEQAQSAPVPATAEQTVKPRHVTQEEAKRFLQLQMAAIPKTTLGVALCVWSPIALIGLPVLRSTFNWGFPEEICSGIGLCVLLVMVAAGVALLLTAGGTLREFEYLEREPIETDNGAREQALHMQREMASFCTRQNTIGVVLCILSVLPLFALMCVPGVPDGYYSLAVCALLLLVGIACLLLVRTGALRGSVDRLLEQGDYTRENKAKSRFVGAVSAAYWLVVTAAFLFYTFGPNGNGQPQYSWFIWAIAGVLYGALMAALSVYRKKSK